MVFELNMETEESPRRVERQPTGDGESAVTSGLYLKGTGSVAGPPRCYLTEKQVVD